MEPDEVDYELACHQIGVKHCYPCVGMVPLHTVPDLTLASGPWGAPGSVAEVAPLDIQELPDSRKVFSFAEIVLEDTLQVETPC